ncbi:MAG: hypothetical protein UR66_C0019G0005 [Candidatus Moranbacteria bacterium GW2011_GWE1_35_17]|nr:MAG: hypothetical protein UR66_C0019G0005 [Candidatus Moranbacteria bacterium GW2011_GWE1_35_17]HCU01304.1 hypothetical protein [Candidatus Nomurabacteria bacterium]
MILKKLELNSEVINAIFIIVLNTFLILAGFAGGFIMPLFLLVMIFSFWISFLYPRSGIYAIVFLTLIFERFFTLAPIVIGYQEYKLYPIDIILGATFISYFIQIGLNIAKKNNLTYLKENKYLSIFFILIIIHFLVDIIFLKTDNALAFSSFKYYIFYPWLYFVILFFFKKREDVLKLFKFYLAGAIGIIFFIMFGILNGNGLWTEYTPLSTNGVRILAFTHSFYILMGLLGVWIWSLYHQKKTNVAFKILMIVWTIGIIGSLMRHLWIGLVISLAIIYFAIEKEKRKIFREKISKGLMAASVATLFIAFLVIISPHYSSYNKLADKSLNSMNERVGSLFLGFSQDESFSWRELVWKESLSEYIKNPLWGMGFGQKVYVESDGYKDFVEVRNIHNSWLVLLFQGGFLVAGFFIFFIFGLFFKLVKIREKGWQDILLIVLFINYLILAVFQPYWETNMLSIFFWIILGLMGVNNSMNLNYENSRNK